MVRLFYWELKRGGGSLREEDGIHTTLRYLTLSAGVIPKPRVFTSEARACPELAEGDLSLR
jgi:hypothetical protein